MESTGKKRLESLDALRGADLFFLVALGPLALSLNKAVGVPWMDKAMWAFRHVAWEGFSPWDLIMPLFMFMSGITIPFALAKYRSGAEKSSLFLRLFKRVALLWLLGMACQGNLLSLDPSRIYLFSNTLQAIAVGYLVAALLFVFTKVRTQIIVAGGLLVLFWAAMQFIVVQGYGGGDYTTEGNLAEWIDRAVLGRFRDGAQVVDGEVVFASWYHYTWILSSLNFAVTAMTGVFAGCIAKSAIPEVRKLKLFFFVGFGMIAAALLWGLQMPIIKTLWTSTMVLLSSGICFLLMGTFYYWIDYKGHRKGLTWLKVYGMNSIAAYMLAESVNFRSVSTSLFHGFEQYLGDYYPFLITLSNVTIVFLILLALYRLKIFIKV